MSVWGLFVNFNAGYEIAGEMVHKMNKTEKSGYGYYLASSWCICDSSSLCIKYSPLPPKSEKNLYNSRYVLWVAWYVLLVIFDVFHLVTVLWEMKYCWNSPHLMKEAGLFHGYFKKLFRKICLISNLLIWTSLYIFYMFKILELL